LEPPAAARRRGGSYPVGFVNSIRLQIRQICAGTECVHPVGFTNSIALEIGQIHAPDRIYEPYALEGRAAARGTAQSGEEPEIVAALEAGEQEQTLALLLGAAAAGDDERRERVRELAVALFGELGTSTR
jgi:hypothetical protein